jgi:hypothetical protein
MERLKYSDLLNRLEGFDAWLSGLGLAVRPNDRIHEAFKVLRRAEEASRRGRETGIYTDISPGDWFPIVEALEAHDVFDAFQNDRSPAIAPTLKRALSGPIRPISENSKNRDGRNIWFELALAAEWRLRGASVILEEPDIRLKRNGVTFLVACKRPANEESIQVNLCNALKQLRHSLDRAPDGFFGVAAISLSCVFNAGDQVFSGETNALGRLLEIELDKCRPYIATVRDPKICCVLFQAATPGLGGDEVDLVRASFTVAQELTPSLGSKIFEQHAQDMHGRPKRHWEQFADSKLR